MNTFICLILSIIIIFKVSPVYSEINQFDSDLSIWNTKINIAKKYLREAADLLKVGEEKKACIKQKKAGMYGVEASTSILKIFQEEKVDFKQIELAKRNLQRWEKLKNICN